MKKLVLCLCALALFSSCGDNNDKKKPADDNFVLGDGRCNDGMLNAFNLAFNNPTPENCEKVKTGLNGRSCRAYRNATHQEEYVSYANLEDKCTAAAKPAPAPVESQDSQAPGILTNGKCSPKTIASLTRLADIGGKMKGSDYETLISLAKAADKECKVLKSLLKERSCKAPSGSYFSYSQVADDCDKFSSAQNM
jgi:hypothetical protein